MSAIALVKTPITPSVPACLTFSILAIKSSLPFSCSIGRLRAANGSKRRLGVIARCAGQGIDTGGYSELCRVLSPGTLRISSSRDATCIGAVNTQQNAATTHVLDVVPGASASRWGLDTGSRMRTVRREFHTLRKFAIRHARMVLFFSVPYWVDLIRLTTSSRKPSVCRDVEPSIVLPSLPRPLPTHINGRLHDSSNRCSVKDGVVRQRVDHSRISADRRESIAVRRAGNPPADAEPASRAALAAG